VRRSEGNQRTGNDRRQTAAREGNIRLDGQGTEGVVRKDREEGPERPYEQKEGRKEDHDAEFVRSMLFLEKEAHDLGKIGGNPQPKREGRKGERPRERAASPLHETRRILQTKQRLSGTEKMNRGDRMGWGREGDDREFTKKEGGPGKIC